MTAKPPKLQASAPILSFDAFVRALTRTIIREEDTRKLINGIGMAGEVDTRRRRALRCAGREEGISDFHTRLPIGLRLRRGQCAHHT